MDLNNKMDSQNLRVTIMMPVYNGEKTLERAIKSLLLQTYTNWKCIIVNDGSTDGTAKYLDSIADERFIIIHLDSNKGRPFARQTALDASNGDLLAFLDADDFYHPEKLFKQVEIFNKFPEIDLVSCGMGSFDQLNKLKRVRGTSAERVNRVLLYNFTGTFEAPHAASMVRVKLAKFIGYNKRLKFAQDSDFFVRYLQGKKYLTIGDLLYYYSEFESVTKSKIIKTNFYVLKRAVTYFKDYPVESIRLILITMIKLVYTILIFPFVRNDYFVKKRGTTPNTDQLNNFKEIFLKL